LRSKFKLTKVLIDSETQAKPQQNLFSALGGKGFRFQIIK